MRQYLAVALSFALVCTLLSTSACVSKTASPAEEKYEFDKPTVEPPQITEIASNELKAQPHEPEQVTEVVSDGILMRLSTDRSTYIAGEDIPVTAYIKNLRTKPIKFIWNFRHFPFDEYSIRVYHDLRYSGFDDERPVNYGNLKEKDSDRDKVFGQVQMEPGQEFTFNLIWDQRIRLYPGDIQTPSGIYKIYSDLIYFGQSLKVLSSLDIEVEIVGAETELVTSQEALKAVEQLPEVRQWLEEHSLPKLIKQENGQYYVWDWKLDKWTPASPELAAQWPEIARVQKYVHMKNAMWEVKFSAPKGPLPSQIVKEVNAVKVGEKGKIVAKKAIDIALGSPEVKKWYDEHLGINLVKHEDGQYYMRDFIRYSGAWVKTSEQLYQKIKEFRPVPGVSGGDGVWKVGLYGEYGPRPKEIIIEVESSTGKVLAIHGISK